MPHYTSIFISDIHLGAREANPALVLSFLQNHSYDKLYLIGDIIDVWAIQRNKKITRDHIDLITYIHNQSNTKEIYYLLGNHDEAFRYKHLTMGNIKLINHEYIHTTAQNKKILIIHGDHFDTYAYRYKFLAKMGDMMYQSLVLFDVCVLRRFRKYNWKIGYFSTAAFLKSILKKQLKKILHFDIKITEMLQSYNCDVFLYGHIHLPGVETIKGYKVYNSGDWVEHMTAVVEEPDGTIKLFSYKEHIANNL